jgi:hypothetical protein
MSDTLLSRGEAGTALHRKNASKWQLDGSLANRFPFWSKPAGRYVLRIFLFFCSPDKVTATRCEQIAITTARRQRLFFVRATSGSHPPLQWAFSLAAFAV